MNNKITNAAIVTNIQLIRRYKNYTLQDVATKLSISPTAYMRYEHNETAFRVEMVQQLADIFQVPALLILFAKKGDLLYYIDNNVNS